MKKLYNGGPLFVESERKQRLYEDEKLKQLNIDIFNPLTQPITTKGSQKNSASHKEVFYKDYDFINKANIFIFDLSNNDQGTILEMGMALEKKQNNANIDIYPIISDWRFWLKIKENNTHKDSLYGVNKFVIGALDALSIKIHSSFDEVYKILEKKYGK